MANESNTSWVSVVKRTKNRRKCTRCGKAYPLSRFTQVGRVCLFCREIEKLDREVKKKGLSAVVSAIQRQESSRDNSEHYRAVALAHYSGGKPRCACCGETELDVLNLTSIHGGGVKMRQTANMGTSDPDAQAKKDALAETCEQYTRVAPAGSNHFRRLINEGFPYGHRVLCSNCLSSISRNGYCALHGKLDRPPPGSAPVTKGNLVRHYIKRREGAGMNREPSVRVRRIPKS